MNRCDRCFGLFLPSDDIELVPAQIGDPAGPQRVHADSITCAVLSEDREMYPLYNA